MIDVVTRKKVFLMHRSTCLGTMIGFNLAEALIRRCEEHHTGLFTVKRPDPIRDGHCAVSVRNGLHAVSALGSSKNACRDWRGEARDVRLNDII